MSILRITLITYNIHVLTIVVTGALGVHRAVQGGLRGLAREAQALRAPGRRDCARPAGRLLHHDEPRLPRALRAAGGPEGPLPADHRDGPGLPAHHREHVHGRGLHGVQGARPEVKVGFCPDVSDYNYQIIL